MIWILFPKVVIIYNFNNNKNYNNQDQFKIKLTKTFSHRSKTTHLKVSHQYKNYKIKIIVLVL